MSLSSAYAAIAAGCSAIPQHGYSAEEPLNKYQLTIGQGINRPYWQFDYPVRLVFDCTAPPAIIRMYFHDKSDGESSTDPILTIGGFMAACASPGLALGTSDWFTMASLAYRWFGSHDQVPDWMHFMNYKTGAGSFGLVRSGVSFPVF